MKKFWGVIGCFFLLAAGFATVRLQEYGRHKEKLWLHRCNSIEKYEENRALYPNVEADVVYRGRGVFDITHDADTTFQLSLEAFLTHVVRTSSPENRPRVWLDVKNLRPDNAGECLGTLEALVRKCGIEREQLIVESPQHELLAAFTEAGFYTSCYVDAPLPSRLDDGALLRELRRLRTIATGGNVRALSCPIGWYPTLRDSVSDIDLLAWAHRSTQVEFLVYPPSIKPLPMLV